MAVDKIIIDPFVSPYEDSPRAVLAPDAIPEADKEAPQDFLGTIEAIEKNLLEEALVEQGHNQRRTAEALGLSYDQLRGMVRKYGLGKRRSK